MKRARVFWAGIGRGWKRGRTRINGVWVIAHAERCVGCGHEFNECGCGERVPAPWADTYVLDREAA
jgi:hypothetical protein